MTFAQIRRQVDVGTSVTLTHHGQHGPGDTMAWGSGTRTLPFTREVTVRQGNAVAFAEPLAIDGKSWLYWPKASEVTINADGTFAFRGMTYRIED